MPNSYRVIATRCKGWWALSFPDLPGAYGQAKDESDIGVAAHEILYLMTGEHVDLELDVDFVIGCDGQVKSRRFFFWPASELSYPWRPINTTGVHGGDENCNRTLGIRVPGGMLFVVLNRRIRQSPCETCAKEGNANADS